MGGGRGPKGRSVGLGSGAAAKQCLTPELASLASNGLITYDAPHARSRRSWLPRFYPNLDAFSAADRARINYSESGHDRISPLPTFLRLLPPRRPSVPLFVRASWNQNSFRPEVSVAHELHRYVSAHLPLLPSLSPSLAQFSYPESDRDRRLALRWSVRPVAHQKINRVLFSTDRDRRWRRRWWDVGANSEGREGAGGRKER